MPPLADILSSYTYIWKFDDPEEEKYETYSKRNDLISFRLYTITIMLISAGFLVVDFARPVDYFWVFVLRCGIIVFYGVLLFYLYIREVSAEWLQAVLAVQILVTYITFFILASVGRMPFFFLPNVLLLFFYMVGTVSGLRFRYVVLINFTALIVYTIVTEVRAIEYYHSQYPNIVSNLIISGVTAAFIEKQKRKDFIQYSELLHRKEELDDLNEQKNRIISILSHDISAPLRTISGLLTTYEKRHITKEELDRVLPDVKARLDKVSFLVYSLVRWSKSQMKGFTVQRVLIAIESLIKENITLIEHAAREKSIKIEIDIEQGLHALADLEMTHLIVRNLLSNAIKFTPHGKRIRVSGYHRMDKVLVRISNEGDPIPDAVREKLFSFQIRSLQGTANEAGTGLGLAMSQQFAVLNEGKITLEPRRDAFNTFTLELPFNDSGPSNTNGSFLSSSRDSLNKAQC
ncbi:MAG TPA: HAMP domain-containing sensor histidine kinase [Chryseolinea sp.]